MTKYNVVPPRRNIQELAVLPLVASLIVTFVQLVVFYYGGINFPLLSVAMAGVCVLATGSILFRLVVNTGGIVVMQLVGWSMAILICVNTIGV